MREKVLEDLLEQINVAEGLPFFPERRGVEMDGTTVASKVVWHQFRSHANTEIEMESCYCGVRYSEAETPRRMPAYARVFCPVAPAPSDDERARLDAVLAEPRR
jgi:hypothetical protein